METRTKGKAIIGIAMAAVIVVALMAMAPSVSARAVSADKVIIIGEEVITFAGITGDGAVIGPIDDIGTTGKNSTVIPLNFATPDILDTTEYENELVQAGYLVYNATTSFTVYFNRPSFTLETLTTDGSGKEITSCVKGSSINLSVKTNLENIDTAASRDVDFKITDAKGVTRDQENKELGDTGNVEINFDGVDEIGEYTVYVKTVKDTCNGLDKSSASITFKVTESGVTLTSDVDTQAETGEVVFSGTTNPRTIVDLTVDEGTATNVNFIGGKGDLATTYTGAQANVGLVSITSSKAGAFSFVCDFADTGSYVIKAMVGSESAKVTVDIVSKEATVTTDKTSYSVGQKVEISGTSNIGDSVAIVVDDVLEKDATIKEDGTFSYKWTSTGVTGSRKVEVWIVPTTIATATDAKTTDEVADATTSFILTSAGLTAGIDKTAVALEDEFVISGTAEGATQVEIVMIAPKGAGGKTLVAGAAQVAGYETETASVSSTDYSFSKKITVNENAASGTHYIAVFALGGDKYYGNGGTGCDTIAAALTSAGYTSLTGKTKDQIVAMIKDATVNAVGSDDLIWEGSIKTETALIALGTTADVAVGDTLNITGTCNREKYPILITVTGPSPATTVVATASVTVSDGKYSTSVDTTGWSTGTYAIKADDGDGHVAEGTVGVVTAVAPTATPTAEPTAEPTATAVPTPEPTAEPTATPTPEPPGFEAVFAIAGMLAIAYLVLRKRRE